MFLVFCHFDAGIEQEETVKDKFRNVDDLSGGERRDYISTLGTPLDPPVRAGQCGPGREVWGPLLELLPPRPDSGYADDDEDEVSLSWADIS